MEARIGNSTVSTLKSGNFVNETRTTYYIKSCGFEFKFYGLTEIQEYIDMFECPSKRVCHGAFDRLPGFLLKKRDKVSGDLRKGLAELQRLKALKYGKSKKH